jgi:hypothetical protein
MGSDAAMQPFPICLANIVDMPVGPNLIGQSRVSAYIAVGWISRMNGRLGAVLHLELALHGRVCAEEMGDGEERCVDAGRDSSTADAIAALDVTGISGGHGTGKERESFELRPMRGDQMAIEQACGSSNERSGADRAYEFGVPGLGGEEVEESILSEGASAQRRDQVGCAWNQQDVELGTGGERKLGKNLYAFERGDSSVLCRN